MLLLMLKLKINLIEAVKAFLIFNDPLKGLAMKGPPVCAILENADACVRLIYRSARRENRKVKNAAAVHSFSDAVKHIESLDSLWYIKEGCSEHQ